MKKNGMAWTLENAEPMVRRRVLRANGKWQQYWQDQAAAWIPPLSITPERNGDPRPYRS